MLHDLLLQRDELVINQETIAMCLEKKKYNLIFVLIHHKSMRGRIDECIVQKGSTKTFNINILEFAHIRGVPPPPIEVILTILAQFPNVFKLSNKILSWTLSVKFQEMFDAVSVCPGFKVDNITLSIVISKLAGEEAMFCILKCMQYTCSDGIQGNQGIQCIQGIQGIQCREEEQEHEQEQAQDEKVVKVQSFPYAMIVNTLNLYGYTVVVCA